MLVRSREILADARKRKYGIPGLLGGNLKMVVGQVKAAEDRKSPLILVLNQDIIPEIPLELDMSLLVGAAKGAHVPVATILDHAHDLSPLSKPYVLESVLQYSSGGIGRWKNNRDVQEVDHVF